MTCCAKASAALLCSLWMLGGSIAIAEDAANSPGAQASSTDVLARVGAETITRAELERAAPDFAEDLARVPPGQREDALIGILVDLHLLSEAAEAEALDDTRAFQEGLDLLRRRVLRNLYVKQKAVDTVDEAAVRAAYDERVEGFEPEAEVRARHILVKTEEEAEEVIAKLDAGAEFAELAQKRSVGPSGPQGGDLGFFGKGRMVPAFEATAFEIEPGEYGREPVQTQFGWHVIKVEEKRETSPPPIEQVADAIRADLIRQRYDALIAELRADTPVEIVQRDDEGKRTDAN